MTTLRELLRRLAGWLYRPDRPADVTAPVYYQLRGLPPESRPTSRLLYGAIVGRLAGATGAPDRHYRVVVNERIVEIPFVWRHLRLPPGAAVLEVGHVRSSLSLSLASLGYHVTAVDLRSYPFSHPDLRSIQGDLLAQSLPAESFDAAVAVSVIEHCGLSGYGEAPREEGDRQVVARIHGLLRPGGRFLLSVPYGRAGESRKGWRVYDAEGLAALLGDFRVEAAQYFLGLGREHWTPVAPEALAEVESARRGFVQGVACVCAVR